MEQRKQREQSERLDRRLREQTELLEQRRLKEQREQRYTYEEAERREFMKSNGFPQLQSVTHRENLPFPNWPGWDTKEPDMIQPIVSPQFTTEFPQPRISPPVIPLPNNVATLPQPRTTPTVIIPQVPTSPTVIIPQLPQH
jgi:hypothetical protein